MARGTCWVGYEQKGFKKKGNKSVPNCVKVGTMKGDMIDKPVKAYTGRAVRQPTETDTEFEIRHEYHTPFKGPQKAQEGGLMDQPHLNYMGAAKGKFIARGCGKVMNDRRKKTKLY